MKNVLIVDTSKVARMWLKNVFEKRGFKVAGEADNKETAFEMYRQLVPDLVIMDTSVLGNDVMIIEDLMKFDQYANIVMTFNATDEDKIEDCIAVGAKDVVLKPLNEDRLMNIIQEIMSKGDGVEETRIAKPELNIPKNVLIVDDSVFMRSMIRRVLEKSGLCVVGEAFDGEDALVKYKELKPDMVTLDVTMQKVQGVDALRNILGYDKDAKIAMCSAIEKEADINEYLSIGAKAFLLKPYKENKVVEAIKNMFN